MSKRLIAIKRVTNDMKELNKCPLEGIGIAQIDNDPLKFVVNIELMSGPYIGYKVQLLMTMSENYPINPPKLLIYPNQMIGEHYHHHIFRTYNEKESYYRFCINLLENEFNMDTNEEHTGWNPAYTISSILLQVQNFISDPDMHRVPSKTEIDTLMKSMDNYQRPFYDGEKQVIHTWKNPFPKMYYSNEKDKKKMDIDEEEEVIGDKNEIKEEKEKMKVEVIDRKKEIIKENLTCYFFRENFIDNPEILLGYPIVQSKSVYGKDKIELYPIPQLLTYEAFQMQTSNPQTNNNNLLYGSLSAFEPKIKAANNQYFNNWLPIYVNEAHYLKNLETIKNAIKTIKNETQFTPEQIFDILPIILNKMIIGIFSGKSIISTSYITCYFHYVLLFKRLCREYQEEFNTYVDKRLNLITMNDYEVNKKIVPDIGDFFMLVFLSNKDMSSPEMKKIKTVLVEEFLIRQIYWIFHGPDCQSTMRDLVSALNNIVKLNDDVYLEKFHNDPNFKMRYLDIFNKELHNKNIYNKVINTIANDKQFLKNYQNNFYYAKRSAENRITQSFKKLYNECSDWGRNKLNNLIKENMRFGDFFIEDEKDIRAGLYDACQVNEILKGNDENTPQMRDVLKYAYESQKGNQLLLITFLVLNKLGEQGFMEELEKNYGIYVEVDSFFLEMKKKLKEIKSYKELYEFIKVDLGKDKTELEIIVEAYEKAKQKRYIRDQNESLRINNNYQVPQYGGYQNDYNNNYGNHNRYQNRYNRGRRW
jgi:ubiquitin-protein ligase